MSAKEQDTAEGVKKILFAPKRLVKPISAKAPAKTVKKPEVTKAVGVKKPIAKAAGSAKVEVKESKTEKAPKAPKKPKLKVVRDSLLCRQRNIRKLPRSRHHA